MAKKRLGLNQEIVLLEIGKLDKPDDLIRQNTIAKALSNGKIVSMEMLKPFIRVLSARHLIIRWDRGTSRKRWKNVKNIPYIIITKEGYKEIERLKAAKEVQHWEIISGLRFFILYC